MRVTVIATGFDRQRHAEAEADRSMERPKAERPPVERPAARIPEVQQPKPAGSFEMDDDVLQIPRFLRDRD